jgi:hypothetical protein
LLAVITIGLAIAALAYFGLNKDYLSGCFIAGAVVAPFALGIGSFSIYRLITAPKAIHHLPPPKISIDKPSKATGNAASQHSHTQQEQEASSGYDTPPQRSNTSPFDTGTLPSLDTQQDSQGTSFEEIPSPHTSPRRPSPAQGSQNTFSTQTPHLHAPKEQKTHSGHGTTPQRSTIFTLPPNMPTQQAITNRDSLPSPQSAAVPPQQSKQTTPVEKKPAPPTPPPAQSSLNTNGPSTVSRQAPPPSMHLNTPKAASPAAAMSATTNISPAAQAPALPWKRKERGSTSTLGDLPRFEGITAEQRDALEAKLADPWYTDDLSSCAHKNDFLLYTLQGDDEISISTKDQRGTVHRFKAPKNSSLLSTKPGEIQDNMRQGMKLHQRFEYLLGNNATLIIPTQASPKPGPTPSLSSFQRKERGNTTTLGNLPRFEGITEEQRDTLEAELSKPWYTEDPSSLAHKSEFLLYTLQGEDVISISTRDLQGTVHRFKAPKNSYLSSLKAEDLQEVIKKQIGAPDRIGYILGASSTLIVPPASSISPAAAASAPNAPQKQQALFWERTIRGSTSNLDQLPTFEGITEEQRETLEAQLFTSLFEPPSSNQCDFLLSTLVGDHPTMVTLSVKDKNGRVHHKNFLKDTTLQSGRIQDQIGALLNPTLALQPFHSEATLMVPSAKKLSEQPSTMKVLLWKKERCGGNRLRLGAMPYFEKITEQQRDALEKELDLPWYAPDPKTVDSKGSFLLYTLPEDPEGCRWVSTKDINGNIKRKLAVPNSSGTLPTLERFSENIGELVDAPERCQRTYLGLNASLIVPSSSVPQNISSTHSLIAYAPVEQLPAPPWERQVRGKESKPLQLPRFDGLTESQRDELAAQLKNAFYKEAHHENDFLLYTLKDDERFWISTKSEDGKIYHLDFKRDRATLPTIDRKIQLVTGAPSRHANFLTAKATLIMPCTSKPQNTSPTHSPKAPAPVQQLPAPGWKRKKRGEESTPLKLPRFDGLTESQRDELAAQLKNAFYKEGSQERENDFLLYTLKGDDRLWISTKSEDGKIYHLDFKKDIATLSTIDHEIGWRTDAPERYAHFLTPNATLIMPKT